MKSPFGNIAVILSAVLTAGFLASLPVRASAAAQTVPPDSFLRFRVDTVQQLIRQVKTDPAVRRRYCQLFHVTPQKLVPYIQKNVVESYVPATKTYNVWCVGKNGRLFTVKQHFRAGTRVFALRNGTPVMKWACGNPLISYLPAPPVKPLTEAKAPTVPTEQRVAPSTESIASEVSPPAPVEAVVTVPSEFAPVVPNTLVASSSEMIVPAHSSIRGFVPWIPIAGAAALITSASSSGGGTTPSTAVFSSGGGGTSSPGLVPEPSPAVTLLLGLAPLAGLALLARRTTLRRVASEA